LNAIGKEEEQLSSLGLRSPDILGLGYTVEPISFAAAGCGLGFELLAGVRVGYFLAVFVADNEAALEAAFEVEEPILICWIAV
jgi:hypothetical protein